MPGFHVRCPRAPLAGCASARSSRPIQHERGNSGRMTLNLEEEGFLAAEVRIALGAPGLRARLGVLPKPGDPMLHATDPLLHACAGHSW